MKKALKERQKAISIELFRGAVIFLGLFLSAKVAADDINGLKKTEIEMHFDSRELNEPIPLHSKIAVSRDPTKIYLRKAEGNLEINRSATTETYEVYFHIPVPFAEQVPILLEVESPQLVDYRFIHLNPPNVIVAARMNQAPATVLNWTAWVFVKENTYSDLPDSVPIPTPQQLPDSVIKWLAPTDCVQSSNTSIRLIAQTIKGTTTDLMQLADDICNYCYGIPGGFPHVPMAFDAFYALNWGSSCTGHAHAAAALFRALGIPARSLLDMPSWYNSYFDMHWIIDYYVPDYGWVRMETSLGQNPVPVHDEIVTLVCNPEDEFPLFYPSGIEGYWHTSDPALGMWSPEWAGAHRAYAIGTIDASTDSIEQAYSLTDSVFYYYSHYWGINLTSSQQAFFRTAVDYQLEALTAIQSGDLDSYIMNMGLSLDYYRGVNPQPITTIFIEDFESGPNGWTHGGTMDEWELGTPASGPTNAHSGENCWGIDLDDTYENNADCWILSPPIDLTNQICAYVSFWVWNWVQDLNQGYVFDPLWMDITTDGGTFSPLSSDMGGVNDDPWIPDVGGWTMIVLDLTKYVGHHGVQVRFRFESDGSVTQYGSFIDDVRVYGRKSANSVEDDDLTTPIAVLLPNYPNPFNATTTIPFDINASGNVSIKVYNLSGQLVAILVDGFIDAGYHNVKWDASSYSSGIYFYKLQTGDFVTTKKMNLVK